MTYASDGTQFEEINRYTNICKYVFTPQGKKHKTHVLQCLNLRRVAVLWTR
uniref:Uncharacterized protein n=1 Tax=Oryza brachyantha TaxID=4533 RepID=J3LFU9_ORYBR